MIWINLDEGAVFDILAINMLKLKRKPSENLKKVVDQMVGEIHCQIGHLKATEILESEEFKELIRVNEIVFDAIDKAQNGDGFAREVQDKNHARFTQKTILQEKFFPHNKVTEEKM